MTRRKLDAAAVDAPPLADPLDALGEVLDHLARLQEAWRIQLASLPTDAGSLALLAEKAEAARGTVQQSLDTMAKLLAGAAPRICRGDLSNATLDGLARFLSEIGDLAALLTRLADGQPVPLRRPTRASCGNRRATL